jgi:hypothetical protein
MHGPCKECAKNLELAFGDALEEQVWVCPLDGKCVNPRVGRRNCPEAGALPYHASVCTRCSIKTCRRCSMGALSEHPVCSAGAGPRLKRPRAAPRRCAHPVTTCVRRPDPYPTTTCKSRRDPYPATTCDQRPKIAVFPKDAVRDNFYTCLSGGHTKHTPPEQQRLQR